MPQWREVAGLRGEAGTSKPQQGVPGRRAGRQAASEAGAGRPGQWECAEQAALGSVEEGALLDGMV